MRSTFKTISATILIVLALVSCRQEKSSDNAVSIGKIETIRSELLDEDRTVWVHVPDGERTDSTRYPVLYLMDGGAHFKSVVGLMHQLSSVNGNSICPKMIIVAILNTDRFRDLTPTKMESKKPAAPDRKTGGGETFTNFIAEELIPFIDDNYPTTPHRTLVGHSLGGLMVVNTMTKHGDLFDKYVAIDPSLWWNGGKSLNEYEEALAKNDFRGRSIFLSIANTIGSDTLTALRDTSESTEHYRSIHRFVNTLRQTRSNGLDWQVKYYPEETHGSVPLISEYDAFNFLYRKIPIKLEFAQLKRFEGTYTDTFRDDEELFLHVVAQENSLAVTESWRKVEMQFLPVGNKDFYNRGLKFQIEFRTNTEGEPTELVAFGSDVWKRVD